MTQVPNLDDMYEVQELIGRGGIGEVYSALNKQTGEVVAIKVLKAELASTGNDVVERFAREGDALSRLNHPNIVRVFHTMMDQGHHCIVMEYVGGGTLADLLEQHKQLPIEQVLRIGLELADALSRAHHLKIIHRDIKPANILLAEDGTPRLTDFGVARFEDSHITEAGFVIGTFAYLSPEACRGEVLDVRTDIWSFGVLLYEMLTGRRPFQQNKRATLIHNILTSPITPIEELRPDAPVALIDLIYRMLERNIDARIPRMRMVGAELESIMESLDTEIRPPNLIADTGKSLFETPSMIDSPTASASQRIDLVRLPAFTTPFVGRQAELDRLVPLLQDTTHRLITVVGLGGLGKTRVAVAAAHRARDAFANGLFFVPLSAIHSPENIIPAIAEQMDFTFGGSDDPLSELIGFLREKKAVIILDNFEHLMSGAEMVARILREAPYVSFLVTSRERLRLKGEYTVDLEPMLIPATTDPETLEDVPLVKLFVESARRGSGSFTLDADTAPFVVRICELVHGMPLGVELAAAWLEMLSIDEIVKEIEANIDFLETDLRDVPERHRSIRAVFEYSWSLMTVAERQVFMRLSVFSGGFDREAAQQVAGASLRTLMTLVNKSLLRRTHDGRFIPHKLLREYAEELFEQWPDEVMKARQAHVNHYSQFVSELGASFNTKGEQKSVDSMDTEIENVRAAWRWAVEYKCWDEIGTMLHTMMLYYQARSMLREGGITFDALAQALTEHKMQDTPLYWRTRVRQAMLQGRLGDYTQSFEQSQAALHYFEGQNDDYEQCIALNNMSYACMMQGRYEESAEFATQALPKARAVLEIEITQYFVALGNLGYVRYLMSDYEAARAIYEDFIKESKEAKYSPIGLAFGYNNLGEIRRELGDLKIARQLFEDAYDIFKQYNTRRGMAFSLNNLGGITFMLGDREKAWKMYQKAYRLNKEIGDRYGIGHSVSALGNNAFFAGDYDAAKKHYTEALTVRRELGNQRDVADSLDDLAYLSLVQLDFDNAHRYLDECLAIREEIGDRGGKARALIGLALVDKLTDHDKAGREKLAQAQSIAMELENSFILAQVNAGLGEYAVYDDDFETAQQYFHESLRLAKQLQVKGVLLYAVAGIADLKSHLGQHEDAVALASMVAAQSAMGYNMGQRMAQQVLDASREQVPNLVFEKGQQHGESLELYAVVDRLLSE